jgi:hypothetical protein
MSSTSYRHLVGIPSGQSWHSHDLAAHADYAGTHQAAAVNNTNGRVQPAERQYASDCYLLSVGSFGLLSVVACAATHAEA